MSTRQGAVKRLWWRWKSLRLPWRKKWLVGFDLAGNTFWEFKDALNANRLRRIVHYNRKTHYADINLSPSWIQWLRHTRHEAPTINEQQQDVIRQAQVKQLAAQADARWASKPSYLDAPLKPVTLGPVSPGDTTPIDELSEGDVKEAESGLTPHTQAPEKSLSEVESQGSTQAKRTRKEVRWEDLTLGKSDGGPQPQPWTPRSVKRR